MMYFRCGKRLDAIKQSDSNDACPDCKIAELRSELRVIANALKEVEAQRDGSVWRGIAVEWERRAKMLESALKAAEARPCVEHCREERAAGNGGCGACALCVGEWRHRAELAEHYNKVGDAIREQQEHALKAADAALSDNRLYLSSRIADARSTIAKALEGGGK